MTLFNTLLFSVFLSGSLAFNATVPECEKLTLKHTITASPAKGNRVEISARGGAAPYTYVFYKDSGHLVSTRYQNNWVEGLGKGKYACTVSDRNNCKKTIEFEIQ